MKASNLESTIDKTLADELWQELFTKKGRGWLVVKTESMAPLIRPGDYVLTSRATAEHIRPGDIVVFRRGNDKIVHRVLKISRSDEGLRFTEKGDNSVVRKTFEADDVIGRVTMVKSQGKTFNLYSVPGQLTSRALSIWSYWTSAIVMRASASSNRNVKRVGRVLLQLSLLSSNALVRICCVVWYLSGLVYKESAESNC
jgi:signal peptidase I